MGLLMKQLGCSILAVRFLNVSKLLGFIIPYCLRCEVKNFQGAYALVRRMIRKGVKPDKETYSLFVNAWCKAGKRREAQQFLVEMSRRGFNSPVRGRDLLIEGLLNAGYIESVGYGQ